FCRRFHGGESGAPKVVTYEFDDVINALNEVAPYDWRGFFNKRIYTTEARAPLGGIELAGWHLNYSEQMPEILKAKEDIEKGADVSYSIGLNLKENGEIIDAIPGMAAADAGIGPGMKVIAVNGRRWSDKVLRAAIKASGTEPVELLIE